MAKEAITRSEMTSVMGKNPTKKRRRLFQEYPHRVWRRLDLAALLRGAPLLGTWGLRAALARAAWRTAPQYPWKRCWMRKSGHYEISSGLQTRHRKREVTFSSAARCRDHNHRAL